MTGLERYKYFCVVKIYTNPIILIRIVTKILQPLCPSPLSRWGNIFLLLNRLTSINVRKMKG